MVEREARLHYDLSGYRIIAPGDYVTCAVTGVRIPLADLRYWNAERQEAYADSRAATARHQDLAGRSA